MRGQASVHSIDQRERPRDRAADDLRCDCGKLLARVLHSVLELKCSRCKRVTLVVNGRRFEPAGAPACTCNPKTSSLA